MRATTIRRKPPGRDAQAALRDRESPGEALLCGASGSGKSLLVQQLRRHLNKQYRPFVQLVFPQMPAPSLLAYLAAELAAPATNESRTSNRQFAAFSSFWRRTRRRGARRGGDRQSASAGR